jgi:hypothetical protein
MAYPVGAGFDADEAPDGHRSARQIVDKRANPGRSIDRRLSATRCPIWVASALARAAPGEPERAIGDVTYATVEAEYLVTALRLVEASDGGFALDHWPLAHLDRRSPGWSGCQG